MLLETQRIDMQGFVLLGGPDVMKHRPGGDGGRVVADEPVTLQRTDVKLPLDKRNGEVARPHPVFNPGAGRNFFQSRRHCTRSRQQNFAGPGHEDFVHGLLARGGAGEFRSAKLAGGNVEQGDRAQVGSVFRPQSLPGWMNIGTGVILRRHAGFEIRRQEVVPLLVQARIEGRARRKDPCHFPFYQLLGEPGVLHLVADGDPVALAQQPREVGFDGMVGNAAHGLGALAVARRQRELQLAADHYGVVVEQLVKVAHAEEEERIRILALGQGPLAHERRQIRCRLIAGSDRLGRDCEFEFGLNRGDRRWLRLGLDGVFDHLVFKLIVDGSEACEAGEIRSAITSPQRSAA